MHKEFKRKIPKVVVKVKLADLDLEKIKVEVDEMNIAMNEVINHYQNLQKVFDAWNEEGATINLESKEDQSSK